MVDRELTTAAPGMANDMAEAYPGFEALAATIVSDKDTDDAAAAAEEGEDVSTEALGSSTEPEGAVEGVEPTTSEGISEHSTDEVRQAREYLKLKRVPESAMDAVTDDVLLAWRDELKQDNSITDRALTERAQFERQLQELQAAKEGESVNAVPAPTADLQVPEAVMDHLGLDSEGAKALSDWMGGLLTEVKGDVSVLREQSSRSEARRTFNSMAEAGEFGGELSEGAFDDVYKQAVSLADIDGAWSRTDLSGNERVEALFRAAARLAIPDAPSGAELTRRETAKAQRRNGAASGAKARKAPVSKRTDAETLDDKIGFILSGANLNQVRARFPDSR